MDEILFIIILIIIGLCSLLLARKVYTSLLKNDNKITAVVVAVFVFALSSALMFILAVAAFLSLFGFHR